MKRVLLALLLVPTFAQADAALDWDAAYAAVGAGKIKITNDMTWPQINEKITQYYAMAAKTPIAIGVKFMPKHVTIAATLELEEVCPQNFLELAPIKVEILKIIDGDTVDVKADLFEGLFIMERVRLADIDTPELHPRKRLKNGTLRTEEDLEDERMRARMAREFVERNIQQNLKVFIVRQGRGKYGRLLADIYYIDFFGTIHHLNQELLDRGLAAPYPAK